MTAMHMKAKQLRRGQAISLLAAIVLVVGLVLAVGPSVAQAAASTWTVDATFSDNSNCNTGPRLCKTIQAAVTAATAGDTINVAAGTYDEIVNIPKSITLRGANAGIHPAVGTHATEIVGIRGSETILSHTGPYALGPTASNITVDGFKFTGGAGQIIRSNVDANNFHLTNSIFANPTRAVSQGVIQFGSGSHTDMVIDFNLFQDKGDHTLYAGGVFDRLHVMYNKFNVEGNSIFWVATPLVDGVIEGNEFDGTIGGTPGVGSGTINIGQGGNIVLQNNWFHDIFYTPVQIGIIGGSVTDNVFERIYPWSGYWASAFELWGGQYGTAVSSNVSIENNTFHYNDVPGAAEPSHGLRLRAPETGAGIDGSTIHIKNNEFLDGGVRLDAFAIRHQGNQATAVDASGNWWSPNLVTPSLFDGNVNYVSWCTDSTCTALDGPIKNVTQNAFFATIQAAIDAADPGDTINVAAGTYAEEIIVNKQVTLQGANAGVAAGANTGTRGSETIVDGGFIVSASGAKIDGFAIQNGRSSGSLKVGVAVASSDVTIANTIIENVASPAQSDGISTQPGNNNLTLINNTIRNNWRGIYLNPGSGHVFNGNLIESTVLGSGSGVGIGSDGLNNTTLTGNKITGFTEGWGSSSVGANVSAHFNSFVGNTAGINHYGGSADIDARNNWWGSASGPGGEGPGTGDAVSTNVLFDPWMGAELAEVNNALLAPGESLSGPGGSSAANSAGSANSLLVVLSRFAGNPSNVPNFAGASSYFDIFVSGATASDSLDVVLPAATGGGYLYIYDGSQWVEVLNGGNPISPSSNQYIFTLDNNSTPKLTELDGTYFTGAGNEEIRITPSTTTVAAGETFQVVVDAGSDGLFGVDVSMTFDKDELEVTSISLGKGGAAAGLDAETVAKNTYDNGAGTLRFAYSQKAPKDNIGGVNLVLATITFRAKAAGATSVTMGSALFTDKDGNPATPAPLDSPIALTIDPSPSVVATVQLQGRTDYSGAALELVPTTTGNVLIDPSSSAAGALDFDPVPAATYDVRISAAKYLAAAKNVTIVPGDSVVNLTPSGLQLLGGDINGDDRINIQDLVLIGANFGSTINLGADINNDGIVNIQDLAIAAGNFAKVTADYSW